MSMDSLALICDKTIVSDRGGASIAPPVLEDTNLVDEDNGGGGRCHNLKNGRKPVKIQRKVQQDALGKVNRIKEISRREQDGSKSMLTLLMCRRKRCSEVAANSHWVHL